MNRPIAALALATLVLAACSSNRPRATQADGSRTPSATGMSNTAPSGGGYLPGDGPGANAPADLDAIPDAVPRSEALHRYANRPYVALGQTYKPRTVQGNYKERGIASWYGKKFHGQRTSSGETYDMYGMTAAHPTLPLPSYVRVTNLANQRSVIVRINDRGPFLHDRVIDLSYTAAYKLRIVDNGSAEVEIESLVPGEQISVPVPVEPVQSLPLQAVVPVPVTSIPLDVPLTNAGAKDSFYLQLGAFRAQQGADSFLARMRAEIGDNGKPLSLFEKDGLVRVNIGPYSSEAEARDSADALKGKLGFTPLLNSH
jgi:rare lipoprotein A